MDYVVADLPALERVIERIQSSGVMVLDVETLGEHRGDPWRNDVAWIALSDGDRTWVVPMGHPNGAFVESRPALKMNDDLTARLARGLKPRKSDYSVDPRRATLVFEDPPEQLTRMEVFGALKPLLFDDAITKVGHNLSFDLGSVAKYVGGIPTGPYWDTMIAAYLIDSSGFGFGLKDVAKRYSGIDMVKGVGKEIERHSFEEVAEYAELDARATAEVYRAQVPVIERDGLARAMRLEMRVLPVVTQMRETGATVDTAALDGLRHRLLRDMEAAKAEIHRVAGRSFNLRSTAEKQELLYGPQSAGGRGLKPTHLTPGGKDKKRAGQALSLSDYSVAAEALEEYRDVDPLVSALLRYADLDKLLGTYVIPYLGGTTTRVVDGVEKEAKRDGMLDGGRIHADFNQIGAATGRMSSRRPNLQNVPNAATDYGKAIRNLFVAPPGHVLVVADYSQIEPRIIASLSKDPTMLATYRTGGDIYTTVGDTMGVDRKSGKVLVLSIAYGVGPDKIASQIGCTLDDAKVLLDRFAEEFANIGRLRALTIRTARKQAPVPFVATISGRRRYLPDLNSDVWWQVAKAERQAFNTLIQGSAADVMKIAMVRAADLIPEQARLILTVHDELVTVAPRDLADETCEAIREAMEDGFGFLRVPLVADIKVVEKWGEAK